jgi:membrane associated rhomboid family serine protease
VTDSVFDPTPDPARLLAHDGPLTREMAVAALDGAARLMTTADFAEAGRLYQRVVGFNDPAVTSAALLGLGEALLRLDEDEDALRTWEEVTRLPESPSTYPAWRNIAAGRVRAGNLRGAMDAYREADRRAPAADKPEIASRLGWLAKETGDQGAAGRYFAKARGDTGLSFSVIVIAVTIITSLTVGFTGEIGAEIGRLLALSKPLVAEGEIWRLWTVTLVHAPLTVMPFHLLFNMYALWLAGPFVERLYGRRAFLVFYLLFAAGGSLATFAFGSSPGGVGASGAVFGLFGLLFGASRIHRPVLDRQSRAFLGQLGGLLAINLVFGLLVPGIDNLAHIGGLITGVWIAALFAPTRVPTMRTLFQMPVAPGPNGQPGLTGVNGATATTTLLVVRLVGVLALLGLMAAAFAIGVSVWS